MTGTSVEPQSCSVVSGCTRRKAETEWHMELSFLSSSRLRVVPDCWEMSSTTRRPWRGFCRSSCSSASMPGHRRAQKGSGSYNELQGGQTYPLPALPSPRHLPGSCNSRSFGGMLCPVTPTHISTLKLQRGEGYSGASSLLHPRSLRHLA